MTSIQSGMSQEQVQAQLQRLHKQELLITEDVLKEAEKQIVEECAKRTPATVVATHSADSTALCAPLFCKDTIYHASICSHVVSTCDAGDYQKFFKNKDLVPGHSFRAVSLSRTKKTPSSLLRRESPLTTLLLRGSPTFYSGPNSSSPSMKVGGVIFSMY